MQPSTLHRHYHSHHHRVLNSPTLDDDNDNCRIISQTLLLFLLPLHPVHRHRHCHHRHRKLFFFPVDSKSSSRDVVNGRREGKRRPCRKSLYVLRVNGFFSDGVNSRVPTTDAVRRWGLGRIILMPSFLGVNVLSIFFFYIFLTTILVCFLPTDLTESPKTEN